MSPLLADTAPPPADECYTYNIWSSAGNGARYGHKIPKADRDVYVTIVVLGGAPSEREVDARPTLSAEHAALVDAIVVALALDAVFKNEATNKPFIGEMHLKAYWISMYSTVDASCACSVHFQDTLHSAALRVFNILPVDASDRGTWSAGLAALIAAIEKIVLADPVRFGAPLRGEDGEIVFNVCED